MTPKKLRKLRQKLDGLRGGIGNMPSRKLEKFAKSLGRRLAKRGPEPNWVSDLLPKARPISIPHHSRNPKRGTATNILDAFERDLDELEAIVAMKNQKENGHG